MEPTWRPICYGLQWCECRTECVRCPFKGNCEKESAEARRRGGWKFREAKVDG